MDTRLTRHAFSAEHADGLEEYGGDYQRFESLDRLRAAEILQRRRQRIAPTAAEDAIADPSPVKPERAAASPPMPLSDIEAGPFEMTSMGRLLVVGRDAQAVAACGERLSSHLRCLPVVEKPLSGGDDAIHRDGGLLAVSDMHIRGGFGHFRATARMRGRSIPLSRRLAGAPETFDLVLDLRPAASRDHEVLPPGYHAPEGDPSSLENILAELPQMVGVFAKPRFVHYDAGACAGPEACGRCRAVCPSAAIAFRDTAVAIDHAACPGCGVCSTACPTGAMQYRQPTSQELLVAVHGRIADVRLESRFAPTVLFYEAETDHPSAASWAALSDRSTDGPGVSAPEDAAGEIPVVMVPLSDVGCAGPEVWLSTLAYGAAQVVVQLPASYPGRLKAALADQHAWAAALLKALGHPADRLQLLADGESPTARLLVREAVAVSDGSPFQPKRTLIRRSALHLATCGDPANGAVPLPEGAPFGAVAVDNAACTLCLACCGACPAGALSAPGEAPALHLVESNCIQCGRCRDTCPEQALTLAPRLLWAPVRAEQPRTLHAEAPMACIGCGRPFAPPGLVAKLIDRLDGHWMYRREEDRRRLKMCRDCRLRDLFERPAGEDP